MEGIIMSDNLAVKKIIEAIQQEEIVEACYIKENQDDKIVMYAVINQKEFKQYLDKRTQYLETYNYILYQDDSDENGIFCVFDDGVCFELKHIFLEQVKNLSDCKKIFDRYEQFLETPESTVDKNKLIAEKINLFSYRIYEMTIFYKLKDMILFNLKKIEVLGLLADFYYIKDCETNDFKKNSYVNLNKDIKFILDKLIKSNEIIKDFNYFLIKFEKELMQLPISIFSHINMDFFKFVKKEFTNLL